jgi:hypothetical protein
MKKLMFLFAAALMMVACSNEEIATNDDVQYVSELKLNFGKGDSRVAATHSTAGLKFAWEEGDEIEVYQNIENYSSRGIYQYDATAGSFKLSSGNAMTVGTEYFAVMKPSNKLTVENVGTANVQVKLELDKNVSLKALPLISDVFTADASGTIATMHHLVGMVEIPVKLNSSATITEITSFNIYGGTTTCNIGGEFIATPIGPNYYKEVSSGNHSAYITDGPYILNTSTATSVFIPVLPGTYDAALNYKYTKDDNSVSSQVNLGSITVVRGKITKVSEVTLE